MERQWGVGLYLFSAFIFFVSTAKTYLGAVNVTVDCFEEVRLALLSFKHSVKDYNNKLSSWVGSDCCRWFGVCCNGATGHIVSLHLGGNARDDSYLYNEDHVDTHFPDVVQFDANFLVGDEVNSALAKLTHLNCLDLSGNDFRMSYIPKFIGSLKRLRYLNLSNAGFSGTIPHHLGNLSNLKVLDLSFNSLLMADDIAWVSGLFSIKHLDLSNVDLRQAQNIDKVLYMIPLQELHLVQCGLSSGRLDHPQRNSSGMLPNIKHLDLGWNFFKGPFPGFLRNLTSLTFLDLSSCDLSQPRSFENLLSIMVPSLSELRLSGCLLHDNHLSPTRVNVSTLSDIQHLDLSRNGFGRKFPAFLTNMSSLRSLDLSDNFLNSVVPAMPDLVTLDLAYNNFNDMKHTGLWKQCHLKRLRVAHNLFKKK